MSDMHHTRAERAGNGPSYLESLSCWRKEETKNKTKIKNQHQQGRGTRISICKHFSEQASRGSHCTVVEGCSRKQGSWRQPPLCQDSALETGDALPEWGQYYLPPPAPGTRHY